MGSATHNFYNDAFARQGYGDDVAAVQQLWLAGDREGARRLVPAAIGLGTNLVGTEDMVRERLHLYRRAGVTTLRVGLPEEPGGMGIDHRVDQMGRLTGGRAGQRLGRVQRPARAVR